MTSTVDKRAIVALVFAALTPKCPMCLVGVLAAVGATGLEHALVAHVDGRVLFAMTAAMLGAAIVWLARRRGAIGGTIATLAALLIVCGKHVWTSTALVLCGVSVMIGYALVDAWRSRRC